MQRDVKVGIAIGVLLLALIGIFYWVKSTKPDAASPRPGVAESEPAVGPAQEPVPPVEGPEVAADPNAAPVVPGGPQWNASTPGGPATDAGTSTAPIARPVGPMTANPAGGPVPGGPAPVGTSVVPVIAPPAPVKRTHTVVAGDNLTKIAKQYYGNGAKATVIQAANKQLLPSMSTTLKVGMKLVIPDAGFQTASAPAAAPATASAERKHTVAAKETLTSLSRKYYGTDTKWRLIYNANRERITNPDQLKQGTILTIPADK